MLAGIFDLDVYLISLSMSGMDDTLLGELLCALPARCIATIEDIDAAFTHSANRDGNGEDVEPRMKPSSTPRSRFAFHRYSFVFFTRMTAL
jgi:chaperone BCS1